jgi:Fe-S oxidoreductase
MTHNPGSIPAAKARWRAAARADSIVVDIWYILQRYQPRADLGVDCFDRRDHEQVTRHAVKRLQALGYQVTLTPAS